MKMLYADDLISFNGRNGGAAGGEDGNRVWRRKDSE